MSVYVLIPAHLCLYDSLPTIIRPSLLKDRVKYLQICYQNKYVFFAKIFFNLSE
jgi:hypothetical protein